VAWVKLDDKFRVHPKLLAVSPVAGWLWVCGLGYANDHRTDGALPGRGLPAVAPTVVRPMKYAEELVKAGLWEVSETGWTIHDYHHYQPSVAELMTEDAVRVAGKVAGGLARAKMAARERGRFAPAGDQQAHQQTTSSPPAGDQHVTSPVPVPVPEEESTALSRRAATPHRGNGFSEESKAILRWLNEKAGKNFQPVGAHLRFIEARLKDHEPWVLRKVVSMKSQKWQDDPKTREWLRPKTLFNETNFANYVGELPAAGVDDVSAG
jgi:uncharacterized phage protein (TIGR02220 family)